MKNSSQCNRITPTQSQSHNLLLMIPKEAKDFRYHYAFDKILHE